MYSLDFNLTTKYILKTHELFQKLILHFVLNEDIEKT